MKYISASHSDMLWINSQENWVLFILIVNKNQISLSKLRSISVIATMSSLDALNLNNLSTVINSQFYKFLHILSMYFQLYSVIFTMTLNDISHFRFICILSLMLWLRLWGRLIVTVMMMMLRKAARLILIREKEI